MQAELKRFVALHETDLAGILDAAQGRRVTVRLLDAPLHEFLPAHREHNPMMGLRGCRLGMRSPWVYAAQVRAIARATRRSEARLGSNAAIEVLCPFVAFEGEFAMMRALIEREWHAEAPRSGLEIGAMIEVPRACLRAAPIAELADFLSFGTNDLTQMFAALSRDDTDAVLLKLYREAGIVPDNPFESLDVSGVGELLSLAVERARRASPAITIGVCGEHGGDPRSIAFFDAIGVSYVSCSPPRLPRARLAAGQAAARSADIRPRANPCGGGA